MKRKSIVVLIAVGCMVLLPGCGAKGKEKAQEQTQQPAWLEAFYNASYEYRISNITGEEEDEQVMPLIEGKRTPSRQYEKVIEPGGPQVWSEAYSYVDGEKVTKLVKSVQGYWANQESERFYPYGYGENLIFKKSGTVDYNNIACDVYTTDYIVDMAEKVNEGAGEEVIKEPLTAEVSQEYYVDPAANQVLCLITDVADINSKQQTAVFMLSQGISAEEAEKQYGNTEKTREKMEILSYDDSMTIDIPDIDILTAEGLMSAE